MKSAKGIWNCRRSKIALVAIVALFGLGMFSGEASDVAMAIAGIVTAIAGSNAWEKRGLAQAAAETEPLEGGGE